MTSTVGLVTLTPTNNIIPRVCQLGPIDVCLVLQCISVRIDTLRIDYDTARKAISGK